MMTRMGGMARYGIECQSFAGKSMFAVPYHFHVQNRHEDSAELNRFRRYFGSKTSLPH